MTHQSIAVQLPIFLFSNLCLAHLSFTSGLSCLKPYLFNVDSLFSDVGLVNWFQRGNIKSHETHGDKN
jgi:hypothetical protein